MPSASAVSPWRRAGFSGFTIVVLLVLLAGLLQLREIFVRQANQEAVRLQKAFGEERLLGRGENDAPVLLGPIELLADRLDPPGRTPGALSTAAAAMAPRRLAITLVQPGETGARERAVYPYYLEPLRALAPAAQLPQSPALPGDPASHPNPWAAPEVLARAGIRRLPLLLGQQPGAATGPARLAGYLYLRTDPVPLRLVQTLLVALAGLLVLAAAVLIRQLTRQSQVISSKTIQLEEKTRQLVWLERLALAGQLAAGVFHDLKKPILNIRHELDDPAPDPAASRAHMREQVGLFFSLLKQMNLESFVRQRSDEAEYVDLAEVIDRSIDLARYEQRDVAVEVLGREGLPLVLAPRTALMQVFSNLLLNSYQVLGGAGRIRIECHWRPGSPALRVLLQDSGPGLPPEVGARIFEPFYTTKPEGEGTGLGLYIVREIMHGLGGEIEVVAGAGAASSPSATAAAAATGQPPSLSGAEFLLTFPTAEESSPPR